jgi:hypothetical protein
MLFLLHEDADFSVAQSRIHEVWVKILQMMGTTLGDAQRYTTLCFDTFPRPSGDVRAELQQAGKRCYDFRAHVMKSKNEGLTKTYNRFHDPEACDSEILELRQLHGAMDRAVLDAYGWTDLQPRLDFILDYDDKADDGSLGNDRKKPWRYRWVDEDRDEVLARLLELNRIRSEEEAQSAAAAPATKTVGKRSSKSTKSMPAANRNLFEVRESTE